MSEEKHCDNCGWRDHEYCKNDIAIVYADGVESCWKKRLPDATGREERAK